MNKFMRIVVFFDLPVKTKKQRRVEVNPVLFTKNKKHNKEQEEESPFPVFQSRSIVKNQPIFNK